MLIKITYNVEICIIFPYLTAKHNKQPNLDRKLFHDFWMITAEMYP